MRYTPRQDGIQYGMVKDYELYVSDSTSDWGAAAKTGAFGAGTQPTTVTFTKAGRYLTFPWLERGQRQALYLRRRTGRGRHATLK